MVILIVYIRYFTTIQLSMDSPTFEVGIDSGHDPGIDFIFFSFALDTGVIKPFSTKAINQF